jgi:hypothetical protein
VAREREERRQQRECPSPPAPLSQQRRTGVARG